MQDKFITIENFNVRYWEAGTKTNPSILLVHGFVACVEFWYKNIGALSEKYHVVAVDVIGFGKTDKPNITYNLDFFSDFLQKFICALDLKKINLIGHSLGGAIAIYYALHNSKNINKLILISSAGFDRKVPISLRLIALPFIGNLVFVFSFAKITHLTLQHFVYNKNCITCEFSDIVHKLTRTKKNKNILKMLQNNINIFGIKAEEFSKINQDSLTKFHIPTLIIWGKEDNLLSIIGAHKAKNLLPNSKIYLLNHCKHLPMIEYPEQINRIILNFLNDSEV